MDHLSDLERLAARTCPEGQALMHQRWGKLLFMHWRIEPKLLRPLIPTALEIDTFDGSAWIAVVPFTMWDIRPFPPYMPPVPGLSAMHELNVRTYVYHHEVPGVWFFSLDCNSAAAVLAARTFYHLPYYNADITLKQNAETINYEVQRTDDPAADFRASWGTGERLDYSHPGSLEFFLTERYCLYAEHRKHIYRARIFHEPWPLQKATINECTSSMIEATGLPSPQGEPLLHYAEELSVDIWGLARVV